MSIFEHARFEIWNQSQHPFKHTLTDFAYTNAALPGVSNVQNAMDWITAVLYPIPKASVANPAALPAGGNTIGDYRVVLDDGDGKSAGYRWEQREGDAVAKWYKIYDMDFGAGSVLQQAIDNAQELFVQKFGNDDLDSTGVAVAGVYAGQVIYGGKTAGKNLTLRANSGDGVGATTGFIQMDDAFRAAVDATYDFGDATHRIRDFYWAGQALAPIGSASSPAISWAAETTLGFYRSGTTGVSIVGNSSGTLSYSLDNQNANGNSQLQIISRGTGDAYISILESGASASYWALGRDDSDSATFKISQNSTLGTNDFFKITTAGAVTLGLQDATQTVFVRSNNLQIQGGYSGSTIQTFLQNSSSSANSHSGYFASVSGDTAGDAFFSCYVNGGAANQWTFGLDNSDSDTFKISNGANLGTNDFLKITTAGAVSVAASGGQVGFFGVTPASRPTTYSIANVSTLRTYDVSTATTTQLANTLGTLIADLRTMGLVT